MSPSTACRLYRTIAFVVAAFALLPVDHALAQPYYYQPPPTYYHNDTVADTVVGGALGAITGAVIGGSKNREGGALIGAGVGALTGNLIGKSQDRADRHQAAAGAAAVANLNQQANALAVTNFDLVNMTRAGVSDDVIISTMRSRGARLDLSSSSSQHHKLPEATARANRNATTVSTPSAARS